jgi:hypothetical protein
MTSLEGWGSTIELRPRGGYLRCQVAYRLAATAGTRLSGPRMQVAGRSLGTFRDTRLRGRARPGRLGVDRVSFGRPNGM